jgi:hypothetical protein
MYGVPKTLNTRADFDRVHDLAKAGRLPAEGVKKYWQGLLSGKDHYVFDRILADGEDPDGTPPDYIVLNVEQDDGTTERRQQKLMENPDARIFKLGYTAADVETKISELGG